MGRVFRLGTVLSSEFFTFRLQSKGVEKIERGDCKIPRIFDGKIYLFLGLIFKIFVCRNMSLKNVIFGNEIQFFPLN